MSLQATPLDGTYVHNPNKQIIIFINLRGVVFATYTGLGRMPITVLKCKDDMKPRLLPEVSEVYLYIQAMGMANG